MVCNGPLVCYFDDRFLAHGKGIYPIYNFIFQCAIAFCR
ncbi:MAG: hypothetical protein JWP96_2348 [Polaromonas sp.]|nr:hypothetical protein [Polaromonas sp.]